LYVDQPVGTGLSTCASTAQFRNQADITTLFVLFLKQFLEVYPTFRHRDLWLSGESYAGHYLPLFLPGITDVHLFNVRGLILGNPWM
jgi:carboxypeptidase C (cathepsin A)